MTIYYALVSFQRASSILNLQNCGAILVTVRIVKVTIHFLQ